MVLPLPFAFLVLTLSSKSCALSIVQDVEVNSILLAEFKEYVDPLLYRDFMKGDGYLMRWLRAYDFDIQEAVVRFQEMIAWRKENHIDMILREDFHDIDEEMLFSLNTTFDKEGRPVVWSPFGSYDLRKITLAGAQQRYQRYMIRIYEIGEIYLSKLDSNITQFVGIYDWSGFNVQRGACLKCLNMIPEFISNLESYYPGTFHKWFFINTPSFFESLVAIAWNFVSQKTKEALAIFDHNRDEWSKALKEQIPLDQLPVEYGGTRPSAEFRSKKSFYKILQDGVLQLEKEFGSFGLFASGNTISNTISSSDQPDTIGVMHVGQASTSEKAGTEHYRLRHHHHYKLERTKAGPEDLTKKVSKKRGNNPITQNHLKNSGYNSMKLHSSCIPFAALVSVNSLKYLIQNY